MNATTKAKWLERARIKDTLEREKGIDRLSGSKLNKLAGLPENAVWREENFA